MSTPPDTARNGAFLALALADILRLGLPDPGYITMNPSSTTAVGLQFSDRYAQDPLADLHAWARRFGADVSVSTASAADGEPPAAWHEFDFTHAGVAYHAYANIADACQWGGCGFPAVARRMDRDTPPAEVPVCERHRDEADACAAIAAGKPVVITEDARACGLPVADGSAGTRPCMDPAGHEPTGWCLGRDTPAAAAPAGVAPDAAGGAW